jgi:hypothetical protein
VQGSIPMPVFPAGTGTPRKIGTSFLARNMKGSQKWLPFLVAVECYRSVSPDSLLAPRCASRFAHAAAARRETSEGPSAERPAESALARPVHTRDRASIYSFWMRSARRNWMRAICAFPVMASVT